MSKRSIFISLIILLATMVPIISQPSYAESYTITKTASDWAIDEVLEAKKLNIIPEKLLNKNAKSTINREEYADIITTFFAKMSKQPKSVESTNPFSDTNNQNIISAHYYGLINGIGDNKADPKGILTREQMSTMILRAIEKTSTYVKGYKINSDFTDYKTNFNDKNNISSYAIKSIKTLNNSDILKGTPDGFILPKQNISREEAIIITLRALKKYMPPDGLITDPTIHEHQKLIYDCAFSMINANHISEKNTYSNDYKLTNINNLVDQKKYYWLTLTDYAQKSGKYPYNNLGDCYIYKYEVRKAGYQMFGKEKLLSIPNDFKNMIREDKDINAYMYLPKSKSNYYNYEKSTYEIYRDKDRNAIGLLLMLKRTSDNKIEQYLVTTEIGRFDGKFEIKIADIKKK